MTFDPSKAAERASAPPLERRAERTHAHNARNLKRPGDDWDARIAAAIAAEHAFMIETVGQALGEYGDMIIDHIEKKDCGGGRQAPSRNEPKARERDNRDVDVLPNPLRK